MDRYLDHAFRSVAITAAVLMAAALNPSTAAAQFAPATGLPVSPATTSPLDLTIGGGQTPAAASPVTAPAQATPGMSSVPAAQGALAVTPPPSSYTPADAMKPMTPAAWNNPKPAPHQYEPGAARYAWKSGITLHVQQGFPLALIFPPWMTIVQAIPGVPQWAATYRISANVVMVQASWPDKGLALTVLTNAGVFPFYLRTYGYQSAPFVTDQLVEIDLAKPEANPVAPVNAVPGPASRNSAPSRYYGLLPAYDQQAVLNPSAVTIPHTTLERSKGDYDRIGPARIFEDGVRTYFDWGPDSQSRPRPVISQLVNGVERPVNADTIDDENRLVVVYATGDFVLRWDQHLVCVIRTSNESAGMRGFGGTKP